MKLIWKAAFAALMLVGAATLGAPASQAGEPYHGVRHAAGTKAYQAHNCRCRKRHAAHRHHRRSAHRYSRRAHGHRYRSRRSGYSYQYAGYWYSAQWWVPVLVDNSHSRTLSHAKWCRQQYGIYYDRRSDTYRASNGRSYRCIRPSHW